MFTQLGYQIEDSLYESANSRIYRARHSLSGEHVILKILNETYPSPEKAARFRHEYEMTQALALPGVIGVRGWEQSEQMRAIVLEDFGAESLDRGWDRLADGRRLNAFWPLALQVAETLGQIHQRDIIHKDLNPANIVVNPATGLAKIIDFGISTRLPRENVAFRNPTVMEGTLAYISPEQTGRMNRAVDYRTDFYSLGVTFYELLTGRLPFETDDALELVHSHIARQPAPPHRLWAEIPEALSAVVMKLLAKDAQDRYQ